MSFTARDANQSYYFNEASQSPSQDALPMSPGRILKATLTMLPGMALKFITLSPDVCLNNSQRGCSLFNTKPDVHSH